MAELAALRQFLTTQLPSGSVGAVRPIREGDELLLKSSELQGLERAVLPVRRASGAGRDLARELCGQLGRVVAEIPRSVERAPMWPDGVVGSISHDASLAVAVVGAANRLGGLGVDIEARRNQEEAVARLIGSPQEIADFSRVRFGDAILFSLKEAVFKAVYPRDRLFLDFHDVVVDRTSGTATTRYGRVVQWRLLAEPRILTLAWW